ncbi:hypothetical protein [Leptospira sp. GIMC2001]|uniref:hypothetical protein n=1 Tax=Leptospira sp. GIMC2001 TaxID=1513297 RepID=UPI00234BD6EA|nr:hypothetical protein [Leptospira sp. GIMC2001]WCL50145.1 hypothetical protein O4O04_04825 [Leptospira sp. GIMC2001]
MGQSRGLRSGRKKQKDEEINSLKAQLADAVRKIEVAKKDAEGKLKSNIYNLESIETELSNIRNKRNSEKSRYLAGRSSSSFYYQMQDLYLEKEEKFKASQWELLKSKIEFAYTCGNFKIPESD